jgi:Ser/Thr protein kinase RdoA (MazF antagonist)
LGEVALEKYGMTDAKMTFQHYQGNVIFRVDLPGQEPSKADDGYYVPNRYNLRILTMNNPVFTLSELTWLAALRHEAGLPVPEPVPTLDGELLTTITTPGIPHGRVVSLMRWVDGQQLAEKNLRAHHAKAWGCLVGKLHRFAAGWHPPDDFKRFHWDWDGLLGNGVLRTSVDELVTSMPTEIQEPFKRVSAQIKEIMTALGKDPGAYGMIHADMFLENVLFKGKEPRLIDFEDCGFGHWMFELGIVLAQFRWMTSWPQIRDAFLEGYLEKHSLPDEQLAHLDLFMAAQHATMVIWASAFIKEDPAMIVEHEAWREREADKLLRYFQ